MKDLYKSLKELAIITAQLLFVLAVGLMFHDIGKLQKQFQVSADRVDTLETTLASQTVEINQLRDVYQSRKAELKLLFEFQCVNAEAVLTLAKRIEDVRKTQQITNITLPLPPWYIIPKSFDATNWSSRIPIEAVYN